MKGLLKNNFYAAIPNMKVFSVVMLLSGIVMIANRQGPMLVIGYMLLGTVGFSINSMAGLRKESATKWSKYKLTAPVKRAAIVKSHFLSLLLWLSAGTVFGGTGLILQIVLHGFPFDRNIDVFMSFVVGIGISLFAGAIFFPLFCFGGEERNEVFLVASLLGGIGIMTGLAAFINTLFLAPMNTVQISLSGIVILACAVLAFALSYPLTVAIYRNKEY